MLFLYNRFYLGPLAVFLKKNLFALSEIKGARCVGFVLKVRLWVRAPCIAAAEWLRALFCLYEPGLG